MIPIELETRLGDGMESKPSNCDDDSGADEEALPGDLLLSYLK